MADPILEAQGVRKSYWDGKHQTHVLQGIDMAVERGEFVAILGPSGSGKSTLLHILGLMDKPTSGKIHLLGKETGSLGEEALASLRNRHLGFVFQFDSLLHEFTVLENVTFPARIAQQHAYDGAAAETRARELLKAFGLERLGHRLPRELSGGERQRAAIARALVNQPSVILADEPTGNLDRHNGELVFNTLKEVAERRGVAVAMVTHNEEAADFASRVVHLSDGILTEERHRGVESSQQEIR